MRHPIMKCSEVRTFLSQISDRQEPVAAIPSADLDYLSTGGYVLGTTKEDYDKGNDDVARLSQITGQVETEKAEEQQAEAALQKDERREHSFLFHFEGRDEKAQLEQRIQSETDALSREDTELHALEANVNELIQKKSMMDRMVPYDGEYVCLSGLGTVVLNDLNVRNYRVADEEFSDFTAEIKAVYGELRSIADKATSYVTLLEPRVPKTDEDDQLPTIAYQEVMPYQGHPIVQAPSLVWSVAIGLAKLQGDANQIAQRFFQALNLLQNFDSTISNKLMAAEVMTASLDPDIQSLEPVLKDLDRQVRNQGAPKELSAGVAATIMAGRRYDGTFPIDRFGQFKQVTQSYETAAILAVMNVPWEQLAPKFQAFRTMFTSWGYMTSEDTEIAASFLAIGELSADEVQEKLKYIV